MRLRLGIGSEDRIVLPQRDAEGLGLVDGDEVEVHTVKGSFTMAGRPSGATRIAVTWPSGTPRNFTWEPVSSPWTLSAK